MPIFLAGRDDLTIPDLGVDPAAVGFPLGRNCTAPPTEGFVKEYFPQQVAVSGGDELTFAAAGAIDYYGGFYTPFGPDGNPGETADLEPLGGISGYQGQAGALVGVFLDDSNPQFAAPPPTLDFTAGGLGSWFTDLAPALRQVFFIGDGSAGAEGTQTFTAPAGATRLFLGVADGFLFGGPPGAYDDNLGSFVVTVDYGSPSYTVTYLAGDGGHIDGASPQTVPHGGSTSPVTAVAAAGSHFVDWSDGGLVSTRHEDNVTADITLTANFAPDETETDLQVMPSAVSVSCLEGTSPANAAFSVRNALEGTVNYTVSESIPWLSVEPTSGSSSGEWDAITVSFTASGLTAGTYTGSIVVTAAGGEVETVTVTLNVAGFLLVREFPAGCYAPGDTVDVSITMDFGAAGTVTSLAVFETVPAGWQFQQVVGEPAPDIHPTPGMSGILEFSWIEIPDFPVTLSYRLGIPGETPYGTYCFSGTTAYRTGGDELTVPTYGDACLAVGDCCLPHQADQNGDWIIQLSPELTRLIQFYNRRGYHCEGGTEDGYGPDAGATTCRPHQADQNGDWRIQLSPELTRLIQFYNSGGYHCQEGTEDGYAPGPAGKARSKGVRGTLTATRGANRDSTSAGPELDYWLQLEHRGTGPVTSLAFSETLPPGWTFQGVTGDQPPDIQPALGATGALDFAWVSIPATWPVVLGLRVRGPAANRALTRFSGNASFREDAEENTVPTALAWAEEASPVPADGSFVAQIDAAAVAADQGWWDLSGTYAATVGNGSLLLNLVHDAKGRITGNATYALAEGAVANLEVRGSVRNHDGVVLVTLSARGADAARTLTAALTLALTVDAANQQLVGNVSARIGENGVTRLVSTALALPIPAPMDGTWSLAFELTPTAAGVRGAARLQLANGVAHELFARGKELGEAVVLTLGVGPRSPATKCLRMRTTIVPLADGGARLDAFSGKGYGHGPEW
jgi:hypothetical protein